MANIQVLDKEFEKFVEADAIHRAVASLAGRINADYEGKNPLFIAVLNGAFVFAADLIKAITIPCQISFIKLSSYEGLQSTGEVKQALGLTESVEGRHVIILEDIVDTGKTLVELGEIFNELKAASVAYAAAFSKPDCRKHDVVVEYLGLELEDVFVVGYGLDYQGYGRNYSDLYKLVEAS